MILDDVHTYINIPLNILTGWISLLQKNFLLLRLSLSLPESHLKPVITRIFSTPKFRKYLSLLSDLLFSSYCLHSRQCSYLQDCYYYYFFPSIGITLRSHWDLRSTDPSTFSTFTSPLGSFPFVIYIASILILKLQSS